MMRTAWIWIAFAAVASTSLVAHAADLDAGFRNPPHRAGIRAFWWWLNSNVTKQAITRDLEEMKAKGFNGALIFDADGSRTRWLQLFLRAGGFFDYTFLDGGMNALPLSAQELVDAGDDESISINQLRLRESLNKLWELGQASEFLSYILSSLRRENIAFVPADEATLHLGISREELRSFSEQLARTGQLRFFETDGNFVYQVDPLLAWKGAQQGMIWNKRVNQFHHRSDQ